MNAQKAKIIEVHQALKRLKSSSFVRVTRPSIVECQLYISDWKQHIKSLKQQF